LILFVTTGKHSYTHDSVRSESAIDVRTVSYGELSARADSLPRGTYVFTDVDRLPAHAAMQAAVHYRGLRELGQKVLTDPARIRSRFGLLRALNRAGINDFDAYRAEDLEEPRRWPVFIRLEGNHRKPVSGLLQNRKQLDQALEENLRKGLPRSSLLIVEYAAEPVRPGLYRKLSVFRVGGKLLGYTCVHDDQWIVKLGKPAIAPPELYEEEYDFVANNPFGEAMRAVFDIAGVEYGRVDFGLVGGRPQIYEINSNPDLQLRPETGPIARRNESNDLFRSNYLAALAAIDTPGRAVTGSKATTAA
jgi:hypothetical protein